MFGISGFELLLIAAFALIIFGPDKLPKFGRTAGRFMRDFKRTQEEMEAMMRAEMYAGNKKGATSPGDDSDTAGDMASMETEPVSRAEEWADDDDEEEEEE